MKMEKYINRIGISKILLAILVFFCSVPAFAEEAGGQIDSGDTGWILTSSALVLLMTIPGLALFYGGMVRNKNVLSTMMHSFIAVCVVSIVWVLWGYTIAFGTDVNGIMGSFEFLGLQRPSRSNARSQTPSLMRPSAAVR